MSKTLRSAGNLTKVVAKDYDSLNAPHFYFGVPHPFEGRLDEDLMALSDGSAEAAEAAAERVAATMAVSRDREAA